MNHRIESMKPSASMVLMARAKQMQKTDPTVIGLAGGEPDFATPDRISMAAIRSLSEGYTHYVVGPGLPELRAAIAKKLREENGLEYDENCILVTPAARTPSISPYRHPERGRRGARARPGVGVL